MLGWAENERSFITSGPSVHVSGTKMSYRLLLVLFSILSFGFLFFHVHHLCMPLLGPELVNKILVSCIVKRLRCIWLCLCYASAYTGGSTPNTAFDR